MLLLPSRWTADGPLISSPAPLARNIARLVLYAAAFWLLLALVVWVAA